MKILDRYLAFHSNIRQVIICDCIMGKRTSELKSQGSGNAAPNSQTTAQDITLAALLKRLKEVRMAVEDWKKVTSKPRSSYPETNKVSQPPSETDHLATSFVNHLSQAQESLLEASHKLKTAIEAPQLIPDARKISCEQSCMI